MEEINVVDSSGTLLKTLKPGESWQWESKPTHVEIEIGEHERLLAVERAYNILQETVKADGWISVHDQLPEVGKYVLGRHDMGTWRDNDDQENVNCVVVKLRMGLSRIGREQMKLAGDERWRTETPYDQAGNNLVPYAWDQFGSHRFFGQQITHWMPIPPAAFGEARPPTEGVRPWWNKPCHLIPTTDA